jgi:hypothetical protein
LYTKSCLYNVGEIDASEKKVEPHPPSFDSVDQIKTLTRTFIIIYPSVWSRITLHS